VLPLIQQGLQGEGAAASLPSAISEGLL
jgi:hypothetical protein